jgi:hypothetical protein
MNRTVHDELARIAGQVQRELGNRVLDFRIVVDETGLILRGRTATFYVKQMVQHVVMRAGRLPVAANEIEVN